MLRHIIQQLIDKNNLSTAEAEHVFNQILQGADENIIAAILVLLRAKGETADEILGILNAFKKVMLTVPVKSDVLDIVGTGGDSANTVNISTAASILAASCGAKVAKHGSRAVSSKCGSSNVLQALGVNLNASPNEIADSIENIGIGFCYAPNFHPGFNVVKKVRAELGVRTVFNILGPLLNPANAKYALFGVFNENVMHLFADVIQQLPIKKAMIVHGNGLDELNLLGPNKMIEVSAKGLKQIVLDPKEFGFQYGKLEDIQGGDVNINAKKLLKTLQGSPGPIADTIVLNAGVALYVANIVTSIAEGIELANENLKQGRAYQKLMQLVNHEECENA